MACAKVQLVYYDCPEYHKSHLVHPHTRRKHRLELNRHIANPELDSGVSSTFAAPRTVVPSSNTSHAPLESRDLSNGAFEGMDIDGGQGSYIEEDLDETDKSDDGEYSTEEESGEENRSPAMSSDYGFDEGEEFEEEDECKGLALTT